MLLELINANLCKRPLNKGLFNGTSEEDWQRCFDMALQQNVLAMTFSAMSSLPKELRPSFTLWSKWMAYAQSIAEQNQYKREVAKRLGSWLAEDGLSTTILKGFSLSALYPNPILREFSDIDIFSGKDYDAVNACFAKHGNKVGSVDGHHAYLKVDSISVDHHFAFSNTKVKGGLSGPEEALQRLVVTDPQPTSMAGICFPNPAFTALFVGWHAYEHFLQEKIELRHVIDWALALRQLSEKESVELNEIKRDTRWGRFADTMTSIAIYEMGVPQKWFAEKDYELAASISEEQMKRVWNDIINAPRTPEGKTSNHRRLKIAHRMLKNNWKYKVYSDISASIFLMKEFVGHVRGRSLTFNH